MKLRKIHERNNRAQGEVSEKCKTSFDETFYSLISCQEKEKKYYFDFMPFLFKTDVKLPDEVKWNSGRNQSLRLWLSTKRSNCHFNSATFLLPWVRSLHCPSKNFWQHSEQVHGKRKVGQLKGQQFLSLDSQSIKTIKKERLSGMEKKIWVKFATLH